MNHSNDERFLVYVRFDPAHDRDPETKEEPLAECFSYEEACRVKDGIRQDCVIRYVGCAGGGD